jgi:catechol 2,3-dioxygenase-like lactoylglutathione lyase family enzyme
MSQLTMPASLRVEIFPSNMQRCINFYTRVLRFTLLQDEGTYAYLQRDSIFIGAVAGVPPHVPGKSVDTAHRRPPCGVELVIEVDALQEERDRVRVELAKLEGRGLEEDLVDRP